MEFIFGPGRSLEAELRTVAENNPGASFRAAVAFSRDAGVYRLSNALNAHPSSIKIIAGLNERGTTVEALLRLREMSDELRVFFKHPRQTFHPKFYVFDSPAKDAATLVVGSSNLTTGGISSNFEASAVFNGPMSSITKVNEAWDWLVASPFCHLVESDDYIKELFDSGYLATERTLRRRRRKAVRKGATGGTGLLPTAPPKFIPVTGFSPTTVPFELPAEPDPEPPPETKDPVGETPLPDRFFVRTLTANDVEKLHGRQVGTFEPDLGQTARDRFPAFWGWPGEYQEVVHQLPRLEWKPSAVLYSSETTSGIDIIVTLWFREARPGHAAEHRIGLAPISEVRQVVPPTFDTSSLVVVERAPTDSPHTFSIRLLTEDDQEYGDFASYLTVTRPQHRYGYGP